MFTITVPSTRQKEVELVRVESIGTVTGNDLGDLPCGSCRKGIGTKKPFASAWIREDGYKERSIRLCYDCGIRAGLTPEECEKT